MLEDKKGGEEKREGKKGKERKRKQFHIFVYIALTVNISHMQCSMPRTF
jgi:hypothetical protein